MCRDSETKVSTALIRSAKELSRRERPAVVAALGLFFSDLAWNAPEYHLCDLAQARGGVWGQSVPPGYGHPILRSTNSRGKCIDVSDPAWCEVPSPQASACALEDGDILVTKSSGSSDLVGKAALFRSADDNLTYLFSNFMLRLRPERKIIIPEYLAWFLRSPQSLSWRCDAQQNAVGLRNLQTKQFMALSLPVPSHDIQKIVVEYLDALDSGDCCGMQHILPRELLHSQRIVARIEELSAKIEEARRLREESQTALHTLGWSLAFGDIHPQPARRLMHDLVKLREPDVVVNPDQVYHFAGVYSFGRGVFSGERKSGMETSYKRLTRLRTGDFVYPKLMAWEGALGVVPPECDGLCVSPEFPVFELNQNVVLPETLDVYFRSPHIWPLVAEASKGTNVRRRRVHPSAFLELEIPLPDMQVQMRLREVQRSANQIRLLQSSTTRGLEALLPSVLDAAFSGKL